MSAALAAEALGESADDAAALAMTERFGFLSEDGLARDPGCHIRANLAFALGRLDYRPASDVLRVGIRTTQIEAVGGVPFDTAAHLRANCALALAQIRDPDCVRDIALLLFDRSGFAPACPDPTVKMEPRKAAARALSLTGSVASPPAADPAAGPPRKRGAGSPARVHAGAGRTGRPARPGSAGTLPAAPATCGWPPTPP